MITKTISALFVIGVAFWLSGCEGKPSAQVPQFEVRDFVVTEEENYSKEWSTFIGKGTIVARNVDKDRNLVLLLEIFDETKGPNSEPDIGSILVRGGIGKIEIKKSKYQNISQPPKYVWKVIGWYELNKATIEAPGVQGK